MVDGGRTPAPPHTRAIRLMAAWDVLGSIEKYWDGLGGFGRIYCRLYCKQYGVMLLTGFKAAKKTPKISQSLSKSPKISHAATHNSAPRKRQNSHAAAHNFALLRIFIYKKNCRIVLHLQPVKTILHSNFISLLPKVKQLWQILKKKIMNR